MSQQTPADSVRLSSEPPESGCYCAVLKSIDGQGQQTRGRD